MLSQDYDFELATLTRASWVLKPGDSGFYELIWLVTVTPLRTITRGKPDFGFAICHMKNAFYNFFSKPKLNEL